MRLFLVCIAAFVGALSFAYLADHRLALALCAWCCYRTADSCLGAWIQRVANRQ